MAFNINAHVILSGPKNIKAVTKSIQSQLGSVKVGIQLDAPKNLNRQIASFNKSIGTLQTKVDSLASSASKANVNLASLATSFNSLNASSSKMAKSQSSVQNALDKSGKSIHGLRSEVEAFGKDAALAVRRFAAFTVATGAVFGFVRAVTSATKSALDYQREIVKVIQVTGAGQDKIDGLNRSITQLSTSLGIDANELAELARMFAQTGQSIDQVQSSIRAVARASLAPTFGSMKDTAEGLIAAMAQFNIAASQQEAVLSSLNAVSKKFAVESEDLISVIRRAGGVFAASSRGFDEPIEGLNQLIGIFTAVRSTTRESADTIAVGLRTIFTRIQRRGTIDFLKQFNIELVDAQGNFIGLFPAFQALSKGLDEIIRRGDALTLSAITEELGGVRQVGKLIPAITQFNKALAATQLAGEAARQGLGSDVALALQPLGKQFELLQQRFNALIRSIADSNTFQGLAKVALSLGNAFLSVAESLKPLIPLMTTFAAIKLSRSIVDFSSGFIGGLKKGGGVQGAGQRAGGAISGAPSDADKSEIASRQALATALSKHATLLGTNNTQLGNLHSKIGANTISLDGLKTQVSTSITQVTGAIGNLINSLNTLKFSGGMGGGFSPFGGGVKPRKFAKGGFVSGPSHAQGGVPAILEGGEYVIPKGFNDGGRSRKLPKPVATSAADKRARAAAKERKADLAKFPGGLFTTAPGAIGGFFLQPESTADLDYTSRTNVPFELNGQKAAISKGTTIKGFMPHRNDLKKNAVVNKIVRAGAQRALNTGVTQSSPQLFDFLDVEPQIGLNRKGIKAAANRLASDDAAISAVTGYLFEGIIQAISGAQLAGGKAAFDFPNVAGAKSGLAKLFTTGQGSLSGLIKADAKRTRNDKKMREIVGKLIQDIQSGDFMGVAQKFAAGGSVFKPRGTDTVPAMLTPGEFVINKSSAQKVGYGNLNRINRYAQGGIVTPQYLATGGITNPRRVNRNPVPFTGASPVSNDMQGLGQGAEEATAGLMGLAMAFSTFNADDPLSSLTGLAMVAKQSRINLSDLSVAFKKMQASMVAGPGGIGGRLKGLGKSLKSFKGLSAGGGMMAAMVAGPLGDAIGGALQKAIGKQTQIKGTTIEGIEGATTAGGAASGAAGKMGAAATSVAVGAMFGPIGLAVGGAVGAIQLFMGAMEGAAKQARFLKFKPLAEAVEEAREKLAKFNKLENVNVAELRKVTTSLDKVALNQKGTFTHTTQDKVIRGRGGSRRVVKGSGISKEAVKDFEARVQIISEGFGAQLSEALDKTLGHVVQQLDGGVLKQMAAVETTAKDPANQQATTISAFKQLNDILDSVGGETGEYIKELEKIEMADLNLQLTQDIDKAAKKIGGDGGKKLQTTFEEMGKKLGPAIEKMVKDGDPSEIFRLLATLPEDARKEMEKTIVAQMEESNEKRKGLVVTKMVNDAAKAARKSLDALGAGLGEFAKNMSSISGRVTTVIGQLQSEFSQLTGDKIIGELSQFNPFENFTEASDQEIDAAIGQLKGLGGSEGAGDRAFQGLGAIVKAQRDMPGLFKGVVDKLRTEGGDVTDVRLEEALKDALGGQAVPPEVFDQIKAALVGGRQGKEAFSIDILEKALKENGELVKQLNPEIQKWIQELGGPATKALMEFKNSILRAADLQQQMNKVRLASEMDVLNKQIDIRDRVNRALGRTVDPFQQANKDLQKQIRANLGGGVAGGGQAFTGNPLDPTALGNRLTDLKSQRETLRGQLGLQPGQGLEAAQQQGAVAQTEEAKKLASNLADVNSQINGTQKALELFATNTTLLAAKEAQIAKAKDKEQKAMSTGISIVQGLEDLRTGKITEEQFGQQIVAPLQNVEDAFSGNISTGGALDLFKRMQSGDQLTGGLINQKIAEIADSQNISTDDARKQFMDNLTQGIMESGIGMAGGMDKKGLQKILQAQMSAMGDARTEQEVLADELQTIGDAQIQAYNEMLKQREKEFAAIQETANKVLFDAAQRFEKAVDKFAGMRTELPQETPPTVPPTRPASTPASPAAVAGVQGAVGAVGNVFNTISSGGGGGFMKSVGNILGGGINKLPMAAQKDPSRVSIGVAGARDKRRIKLQSGIESREAAIKKMKEQGAPEGLIAREEAKLQKQRGALQKLGGPSAAKESGPKVDMVSMVQSVGEVLTSGGANLGETLSSALNAGGATLVQAGASINQGADRLAESMNSMPEAIDLRVNMGSISVNINPGDLQGLLADTIAAIPPVVEDVINSRISSTDGSIKSPETGGKLEQAKTSAEPPKQVKTSRGTRISRPTPPNPTTVRSKPRGGSRGRGGGARKRR